jgi:sRNA-binding regulator protein Hfq
MTGKTNETVKPTQHRFLQGLKGKEVLTVFLDGKAVHGVLTGYDPYTLFLQREDGMDVAVFKHAIKYLHLAPRRS